MSMHTEISVSSGASENLTAEAIADLTQQITDAIDASSDARVASPPVASSDPSAAVSGEGAGAVSPEADPVDSGRVSKSEEGSAAKPGVKKKVRRPKRTREEIERAKGERLERKRTALRLLKTGEYTQKKIAEIAKVAQSCVSKLAKELRSNPDLSEEDIQEKKRGPEPNPYKKIAKRYCNIIFFIIESLFPSDFGIAYSAWCAAAISIVLSFVFNISVSKEYVRYWMNRMGATSKVGTRRNPAKDVALVNQFVEVRYREIVKQAIRKGELIIFLDETHVKKDGRGRGYGLKGARAVLEHAQRTTHSQHTLITVMGPSGFCYQMVLDEKIYSTVFVIFLDVFIKNNKGKKFLLLLDKASFHTSRETKNFLDKKSTQKHIRYEYLPPNAPDLNPVEQLNNHFKGKLRIGNATTLDELHEETLNYMGTFNKKGENSIELIQNFFRAEECEYSMRIYEEELAIYQQEQALSA